MPDTNTTENITDRFRTVVTEHLGVHADQVTSEASFHDDLGADSLDMVELAMAAEEEFGIEVPDEDAERMTTFGEAVKMLSERAAPVSA